MIGEPFIDHLERTRRRREAATLFLLSALLLALLGGIAAALWYAAPRTPYVSIGRADDYPPGDQPYRIEQGEFRAWVVNTSGELLIFEPHTPHHTYYPYVWLPPRMRFEDPLTGSKFTLTGRWLDGPAPRDLDQYPYRIVEGEIQVETWRIIRGVQRHGR